MQEQLTFQQIKEAHPFPWKMATVPNVITRQGALIILQDSSQKEVPLFTALRLIELVTNAQSA